MNSPVSGSVQWTWPHAEALNSFRVETRYMGSGIKGLRSAGIRDHSPQRVGSGSAVFFMGSGIKFLRVQGSKFSSFLGSGFKFVGNNMGSVTKTYTSLRA